MTPPDDKPSRRHVDYTGRPVGAQPPAGAPKPGPDVFARIPGAYKVVAAMIALVAAGAGAHAYITERTASYLTTSAHRAHVEAELERYEAMRADVQALREGAARRDADVKALREDISGMRDDVRQLLRHMLANPRGSRSP
jgi:hypothetical protein